MVNTDRLVEQFCAICADILQISHAHPRDNFFDLGGDSLTATRVCFNFEMITGQHVEPIQLIEADSLETCIQQIALNP